MTKLNLFVKIDVQQLSRRFNVMRKKKNFGERKRRRDMQWVKTNDGKWEHVDMNDRMLRHEMETINQKKKS